MILGLCAALLEQDDPGAMLADKAYEPMR